jgi:AcrR family transcriptional regulator
LTVFIGWSILLAVTKINKVLMPYRSSEKTRQKKDAKRTAMMQAAVRVFAEKGYHSATIRDIVAAADVAVGTFYFYFPDKETLFVYLYEETAEFLLQTLRQAISGRVTFPKQITAGIQAYVNIGIYEPAVVYLLLVGGVGAVQALVSRRSDFREELIKIWLTPLEKAADQGLVIDQNTRRSAEALAGAVDEVILNLLDQPDAEAQAPSAVSDLTDFALRAVSYIGT